MSDEKEQNNKIVLVSTDKEFLATTRTAFSVSDAIQASMGSITER